MDTMRRTEPPTNTQNLNVSSRTQEAHTVPLLAKELSFDEAHKFWKDRHADGKLDAIFEQLQNKLLLLQQKIKDGSATNQEYIRAMVLVNAADLKDSEAVHCGKNITDELQKTTGCLPTGREEACLDINTLCETEAARISELELCNITSSLPAREQVPFEKHICRPLCLSEWCPSRSLRENPLKIPVVCHFQRRHAKTNCLSKALDVIYKAPCRKSLRNFEEVRSYLFQTECASLSVDNFSFNTYLQLDRSTSNSQAIVQDSDISKDVESVPVSFCNEIDSTRPSSFKYRKSSWPRGYSINNFSDMFIESCSCTDGCLDISTCACLQLSARAYNENTTLTAGKITPGYTYKRLQRPVPSGVYECNVSCKCDRKTCQNRVVQHGLQVRLQVFKTEKKGWGVRCLDDIDKGTFVCTYAGRILIRNVDACLKNMAEDTDASNNLEEGDKATTRSTVIAKRMKRRVSHSDSEITLFSSAPCSRNKLTVSQLWSATGKPEKTRGKYGYSGRSSEFMSIRRPKTRTAILQKRRKQLMEEGASTLLHSSEEDCPTPQPSPKEKPVTGADNNRQEEDEADKISVSSTTSEMLRTKETEQTALDDESVESNTSILSDVHPLDESGCEDIDESQENYLTGSQSLTCLSVCPNKKSNETVYLIDASKEGNVGRFLNHSCCPNLFAQNVFVETHNKSFPWVAFFTKRHVKAGTELTWEYNYDVGSIPEKEIPCLCGQQACRKITV
ncbi:hypothetical protein FKM82_009546 [Ascaphus truei]